MIDNNIRPVAVDVVILAMGESGLNVLLIKINFEKHKNKWAMPGRLISRDEDLEVAAKKIVATGVSDDILHLEQMYTFGDLERDKEGRSVSVVYFALVSDKNKIRTNKSDLYADIKWFSIDDLPETAFGHEKMIRVVKEKLAYKLDEIEVVKSLLPEKFTLADLKVVHEVLSGKSIDKRNFVKKIKAEGDVVETSEFETGNHRPAKLFQFK